MAVAVAVAMDRRREFCRRAFAMPAAKQHFNSVNMLAMGYCIVCTVLTAQTRGVRLAPGTLAPPPFNPRAGRLDRDWYP